MKEVIAAIVSKFSGSTVSTAVKGQLYLDYVPEDATLPYIVFSQVSHVGTVNFSDRLETFRYQFSIYYTGTSAVGALDIARKLWDLFDDCTLNVSGYEFITCIRETSQLFSPEDLEVTEYREHTTDYIIEILKKSVRN